MKAARTSKKVGCDNKALKIAEGPLPRQQLPASQCCCASPNGQRDFGHIVPKPLLWIEAQSGVLFVCC